MTTTLITPIFRRAGGDVAAQEWSDRTGEALERAAHEDGWT